MLKRLHKNFFVISLFCLLALTPYVSAKGEYIALESVTPEQMNLIQQDIRVNDLDIEPINTQEVKKTVVPDTKKEGQKVFAYFLRAMLGVVLCAIILYFVLIFVKKFYGSAFVNPEEEEYFEAFDLSTPKTKQDALKSFLNRTK